MFSGLKNFAINRVLKHVAGNAKLNRATNAISAAVLLAVAITAALDSKADWMLMFQCCSAPGSLHEVIRIAGAVIVAFLLFFVGKFPGLKSLLPVAQDIIAEAERELEQPKANAAQVK